MRRLHPPLTTYPSLAVLALALGILGCAADGTAKGWTPPPPQDAVTSPADAGADSGFRDAGTGAKADAASPTGTPSTCTPEQFRLSPRAVQVLLLLDRSSSMTDSPSDSKDSWWTLSTGAINTVVGATENTLDWGLMLFPKGTSTADCCKMPTDDMSPLVEVGTEPGNAWSIAAAMAATAPTGDGTPTARALLQAANYLVARGTAAQKLIVLATDGDPTCANDSICLGDESKDYARTKDAMGYVYSKQGIPVAVVGINYPDTANGLKPNAKQLLLIDLATLGGMPNTTSGQPAYYLASNTSQLTTTLTNLAKRTVSCTYRTGLESPWPHTMKITVGGAGVKRDTTHVDGWDLADRDSSIVFFGSACAAIRADSALPVRMTLNCPGGTLE